MMRIELLSRLAAVDLSNVDKKSKEGEHPVRLCNFVDVYHNWAITKRMYPNLMTSTANENQLSRFAIKKGQVAITKDSETRDDIGIPTYMADDFDDVVLGYHCALITPKDGILSGAYLNVVLHSPYASKYFEANASGSGQRYTLTSEIIGNFPVPLIPYEEQLKIAAVFETIDRKIENNNSIISELESMAKDIYDYWFVQFDFPDENGKPYKSRGGKMVWNEELKREIPEGWLIETINSLVSTTRGISYSTESITGESGVPMINLASFNVDASYKPAGLKVFSGEYSKEDVLHPFDLIICNTQQTDLDPKKDIIGKTMLVPDLFEGDIVSSHHITRLQTDDLSMRVFLNATGKTTWFHKAMSGHCSGTSILGLDVKHALEYKLVIPKESIRLSFSEMIIPIEKQKSALMRETAELTSLRDWILPMLMNGQVNVAG